MRFIRWLLRLFRRERLPQPWDDPRDSLKEFARRTREGR